MAPAALLEAGHEPEVIRCYGWEALPAIFNQTPGRRKVRELTGQWQVPVLVTDDGDAIVGSGEIAAWAKEHPAD